MRTHLEKLEKAFNNDDMQIITTATPGWRVVAKKRKARLRIAKLRAKRTLPLPR